MQIPRRLTHSVLSYDLVALEENTESHRTCSPEMRGDGIHLQVRKNYCCALHSLRIFKQTDVRGFLSGWNKLEDTLDKQYWGLDGYALLFDRASPVQQGMKRARCSIQIIKEVST